MFAWDIRNQIDREEIDYIGLKSLLGEYAYPRDKITQLLKAKILIRVKKGLYVFGREYAKQPYSKEVLANLIYGPSAVSLAYALAFYQLIPEQVNTVTSITNKRAKYFKTPVGDFTYTYLSIHKYDIGLTQMQLSKSQFILIATPEKALADQLLLTKPKLQIDNEQEMEKYLLEDLRIDMSALKKFNLTLMREIAHDYQSSNIDVLVNYIQRIKK